MRKRILIFLMIAFSFLFLGVTHKFITAIYTLSSSATVYVDPQTSVGTIGQNFTININVSSVMGLYGWEFKLRWNSTILDVVNVVEGSFLKSGGETFFTYKINQTEGYFIADCTLLGEVSGVNGNGTLASIEFYVATQGECPLDLYDTTLVNSLEQPIEHSAVDGYCYAFSEPFHDIAVSDVALSKSFVGEGFIVYVNVTVSNKGTFSEVFNVSVYYDTVPISLPDGKNYVTVDLSASSSTVVIFTWNTTNIPKDNYTITAYATPVINETNRKDNNFTDGYVIIAMVGDIFGPEGFPDGKVNIRDVAAVASLFGVNYPDPRYNPNRDVIYDGKINIRDVALVATHFGEIDP